MGYNDPNGIYIYEETDEVSPFSEYENKGQRSVSTALGILSDAVQGLTDTKPSPWVDVEFENGWVTNPDTAKWGRTQYRTTAGGIEIRGQILPRPGYTIDETMFVLPLAARPEYDIHFMVVNNGGNAQAAGILIRRNGEVCLSTVGIAHLNLGLVRVPQKGY